MAATTSPPRGAAELLTPPASSIAASQLASPLPQPRKHPLKPGGPKEGELIGYLDNSLNKVQLRVNNRINNRQSRPNNTGDEKGYRGFSAVAKDLDALVDVIWVSGSPNLQIPYLLNIAALITEFLPLFAPSPRATFNLLEKLDFAFSSLLQGRDFDTNEPLPGFSNGRTISITDKVRLKGIVERVRLVVAGHFGDDELDEAEAMDIDEDGGYEGDREEGGENGTVHFEGFEHNEEDDEWEETHIAKVFDRTLSQLGDVLGGTPIGIITDD